MQKTLRLSRERSRWLAALCLAALLMGLSFACCRLIYETNDDSSIVAASSGAITGTPYAGNGFTSYFYGFFLSRLFSWMPAVPWHAVFLLATLYLSLTALIKGLLTLCAAKRISARLGLILFLALYLGALLPYVVMLQFTTVPAMAVSAAYVLLLGVPSCTSRRGRLVSLLVAVELLFAAFGLRTASFWAALPLWLAHAVMLRLEKHPDGRKLLRACLCILLCFGLLSLMDQALFRLNDPGWETFEAYNAYLGGYLDYHNTEEAAQLAQETAGWTPWMTYMVRNWYQLDERMTAESLNRLLQALETTRPSVFSALYAAGSLLLRYPIFGFTLAGFSVLGLFAALRLARRKRWGALLRIAGCGLYLVAFVAYFYGFLGRLPMRAAFACGCPCYVLCLTDFLDAFEPAASRRSFWMKLAVGVCMLLCLATPLLRADDYLPLRWQPQTQDAARALSQSIVDYAVEHPSSIYVTDVTLDLSPWYVYGERLPFRLLSWSSGMYHSPLYQTKLRALGYSRFTTQNLTDPGVLVLASSTQVLSNLCAYLEADYAPVACETVDLQPEFGVYRITWAETVEKE